MKIYYRKAFLMLIDVILVNAAVYIGLIIRFDAAIPPRFLGIYLNVALLFTIIKLIVYYIFGLYRSLWKYASIDELMQLCFAATTETILCYIAGIALDMRLPRSVFIISWMLTLLFVGGSRLSYRVLRRIRNYYFFDSNDLKRVMIIGAGEAGSTIIKELKNGKTPLYAPVVVIDDDKMKIRSSIHGVPVRGGREKIVELADEYNVDEIIVALPSASKRDMADILDICKKTRCRLKKLPGVYELEDGELSLNNIRDVNIEDLLDREEVQLDNQEISDYLYNETILVTGGGGSIGSELCRQIARYDPSRLVIFDIYENNAYELQTELRSIYKDRIDVKILIGSIQDKQLIDDVFRVWKPGVVFHAAAHKHVPLMEDNLAEAVKNNVFGTYNVALCADKYKVKKFVLISSDKAVNPTNVMGATKRIAELIIQALDKQSSTKYSAVRFGNVLGSNGSVIPLFKKQIAQGGPVTVTHPDIKRYFMTISEAAQLVIQSGAIAEGGEIFVLNMGEPVKIVDLARDLIRLSGLEPDIDIKIEFIGLRPGEKMFEELYLEDEKVMATKHTKIFVGKPLSIYYSQMVSYINQLEENINRPEELSRKVYKIVTLYTSEEIAASLS